MLISVVVSTRNRVNSLRRCVNALSEIKTRREWEIVIVNNGSTDGTADFLDSLPKQIAGAAVATAYETKRGLAAARNTGVVAAKGEILAFTDDDCYVTENYIDSVAAAFERQRDLSVIGGRIMPYDPTDLRLTINESEVYQPIPPRSSIVCGDVQGANMAFRRSAIQKVGGFTEFLGPGTPFNCEDADATARVIWAGMAGAYDPSIVVYHHHGRKTPADSKEIHRSYAFGRGAFFMKFILRRDSRWVYVKAWINAITGHLKYSFATLLRGRRPSLVAVRELQGGISYAIAQRRLERNVDYLKRRRPN